MENVEYLGVSTPNCSTINLNSSNSHLIYFDANVEVDSYNNGPVYTYGKLKVAYWTGSGEIIYDTYYVNENDWTVSNFKAYLSIPINLQLYNSNFDYEEGGAIYIRYEETNHSFVQQSCVIDITKPKFTLSPNSTTISCGSNSQKTFHVNNENNSPGNIVYYWDIGNGWSYSGSTTSTFTTTTNSIQLIPMVFPYSDIEVIAKLDGVSFPQISTTVNLASFAPTNIISGVDSICTTENYSVNGLPSGVNVSSWSISDSSIASISSNGNQVTVSAINSGIVTLEAILTNTCSQNAPISKQLTVGKPNVTSGSILGGWDNQGVNTTSQLHVNWAEGATEYYWFFGNVGAYSNCSANNKPKFLTSNGYASTMTSSSRYVTVNWGNCTGDIVVNCMAVNGCGQSGIGYKAVNVYNNANSPCDQEPWSLKTYPNPIKKGSLIVSKIAPSIPCNDRISGKVVKKRELNIVKIYDFYGALVYKGNFKSDDFTIEGLSLKAGHYALHVTSSNGETLRKLITVE